ncbi:hypothetical protein ACFTAO_14020 [Paenibacillus rhizoplanae]
MADVYAVAGEIDKQLGGNSMYKAGLRDYSYPIESYEEAVKAQESILSGYNAKVNAGELLPGAARYFSDYMSLPAGIFPVFLSAFLLLRDRSSRMNELIYSRRVSPWVYVGSKFIAQGIMLSLVYLILAVIGGLADGAYTWAYRSDGAGNPGLSQLYRLVAVAHPMGLGSLRDVRLHAVPPGHCALLPCRSSGGSYPYCR